MPKLLDHPQEIDRTYTPLEARRRAEMRLHDVKYGFYPIAKEPLEPMICSKCGKEIHGQALVLCGVMTHYNQCE